MESTPGDANVTAVTSRSWGLLWRRQDSDLVSGHVSSHRRRRIVLLAAALLVIIIPGLFAALVVRLALSGRDVSQALRLPSWVESRLQRDEIAYPSHIALARGISVLHLSPVAEGRQWLKAAAHVTSDHQIRTVGEGLRATLTRAETSARPQLSAQLCQEARRGSQPGHTMVVALAGLDCQFELRVLGHVPEGQPIYYQNIPPRGGPHYGSPYPTYGVVTEPVQPGYWVHNLEHGAVVVLYRCDDPCPDLVVRFQDLYASLPPNQNSTSRSPRLLVLPYAGLPAPIAMVTWGESIFLDRFDAEVIRDFYMQYIDRGPECRNGRCPE